MVSSATEDSGNGLDFVGNTNRFSSLGVEADCFGERDDNSVSGCSFAL
jgi:hypothetical protein